MISILCWSKDRACQLNALLRSLKTYIPSSVVVLYTYSNDDFRCGYDVVRAEHPFVTFVKENDFYEDTIFSIEGMKKNTIILGKLI